MCMFAHKICKLLILVAFGHLGAGAEAEEDVH
jgi:hypothetical protein